MTALTANAANFVSRNTDRSLRSLRKLSLGSNKASIRKSAKQIAVHMSSSNGTSRDLSPGEAAEKKYNWELENQEPPTNQRNVVELPLAAIRRPHTGIRGNDQGKVEALKASISERGLMEPIDVLEVDGQYWGFNGCHRFQAHQELGKETILCRVRKANQQILKFHLM